MKPNGLDYDFKLKEIKIAAKPVLDAISTTFPEYTEHNIEHSERIIRNLGWFIPESLKEQLSPCELFFLLASAYLHDIGMAHFSSSVESTIKERMKQEKCISETPEEIRDCHHLRSEAYIRQFYCDLCIEDLHQAMIIARVCRGHRNEDLSNRELYNPNEMYKCFQINVPLLAALLRVGDELDITFERTSLPLYHRISPEDTISKLEWEKHLSISGAAIVPGDPLKIASSAHCKDPKIHRLLKKLETKINAQVKEVPKHLHNYRAIIKDIPRQFEMQIESEGYFAYDFKFSLEAAAVIELLMGEHLYRSIGESIREVLKNSLDSCRLKKRRKGRSYNPIVEFQLAPDNSTLAICDNGCGMDEYIIENFFTRVGRSYYQSPEFLREEFEFPTVSEFGIGIISCFMIANRIVVETKAENQPSFKLEIEDIADYFTVTVGTRKRKGTKITLKLKEEAKDLDFEEIIRTYARHLEIPITIRANGQTRQICDEGYTLQTTIPAQCKLEQINIKRAEIEGIISLIVNESEKRLGSACSAKDSYGPEHPMQFVSYGGVFVTNSSILPPWLMTKTGTSIYSDLNLKRSSSANLNLARNELLEDQKLKRTKRIIENSIAEGIREYVNELSQSSQKTGLKFHKVLARFFTTFIRFDDVADHQTFELIADLFKDFYYFKVLSTTGWRFASVSEITQAHKPIVVFEFIPNASPSIYDSSVEWWRGPNTNYLVKMMAKCSGFSDSALYVMPDYTYFSFKNIGTLLDRILPKYTRQGFLHYFKFKEDMRLSDVLPGWIVCKFHNYESAKFIEFAVEYRKYLNAENKFVKLLLDNHKTLTSIQKSLIKDFCKLFEADLQQNFSMDIVQKRQISILETFESEAIIDEAEIESFLITNDDFPPDLLEEWAS